MEEINNTNICYLTTNKSIKNNIIRLSTIEVEIDYIKKEFDVPVLGPDKFIDIKRLKDIFTVINGNVLINNKCKGIWAPLKRHLKFKEIFIYRSAKNILLAYKYIMMSNEEKESLMDFFSSKRYYKRYENFSYEINLSINTLKNYSNYIGTERWKANIMACLLLCKRFGNKREC